MNQRDRWLTILAAAFGGFLALVLQDHIEYRRWLVDWTRAMNKRSDELESKRAAMLAEEGITDA